MGQEPAASLLSSPERPLRCQHHYHHQLRPTPSWTLWRDLSITATRTVIELGIFTPMEMPCPHEEE
ncbi:hypothetical protein AALO_G00125840 [Alosa alosa]|uniref:Uncharacterized protein n=1 Tax=Alosa alosa TaxID=278164 RepID=A0AAV6GLC8_9TELE|nr:hypothetical protein AALO_G00125840 [Alosa alosa]